MKKQEIKHDNMLTSVWVNKIAWTKLKKQAGEKGLTRNQHLNNLICDATNTKVIRE